MKFLLVVFLVLFALATCYEFEDFNALSEEKDLEYTLSEPTLGYDDSFVQDTNADILQNFTPTLDTDVETTDIPAEILEEIKALNMKAKSLDTTQTQQVQALETKPLEAIPLEIKVQSVPVQKAQPQQVGVQHVAVHPLQTA